jgi:NADP-dependent 3-hydroxy acid dehydrogenase YdfG
MSPYLVIIITRPSKNSLAVWLNYECGGEKYEKKHIVSAHLRCLKMTGGAPVPMITKGDLETINRHLAMEYAKEGMRVNAVAPGVVCTPLHQDTPKEVMEANGKRE